MKGHKRNYFVWMATIVISVVSLVYFSFSYFRRIHIHKEIRFALESDSCEKVLGLLKEDPGFLEVQFSDGMSIFSRIALKGTDRCVELISSLRPDLLNIIDSEGLTPLAYAIRSGNSRSVAFMLRAGADCGFTFRDKKSGLSITMLMEAVFRENLGALEVLLIKCKNIDFLNEHGNGVLIWAAAKGNPKFVKMLLRAGATLTSKEKVQIISLLKKRPNIEIQWLLNI